MSVELLRKVRRLQMAASVKAVLVSLADQADDTGKCWPSVARLVEYTCLSERTVRNALRELERVGLLGTRRNVMPSNMYWLNKTLIQALDEACGKAAVRAEWAGEVPEFGDAAGCAEVAHAEPENAVTFVTTPAAVAPLPGNSCPLSIIEANTNTNTTPTPCRGSPGLALPSARPVGAAVGMRPGPGSGGEGRRDRAAEDGEGEGLAPLVGFQDWLAGCTAQGEPPVPDGHEVWDWARAAGVSKRLVRLALAEWISRQAGVRKRRRDWPARFFEAVRTNHLRLWYLPAGAKEAELTSQGRQAERVHLKAGTVAPSAPRPVVSTNAELERMAADKAHWEANREKIQVAQLAFQARHGLKARKVA